jgi:hypothetical protein
MLISFDPLCDYDCASRLLADTIQIFATKNEDTINFSNRGALFKIVGKNGFVIIIWGSSTFCESTMFCSLSSRSTDPRSGVTILHDGFQETNKNYE